MNVKEGKERKIKYFSNNSKGQVTIFIIIAILIVALGILVYLYYPKISSSLSTETKNPSTFVQECLEEKIQENIETISLQGGSFIVDQKTGYYYMKKEEKEGHYVRYLCYTNENLVPCINQEPFLTQHFESEILNSTKPTIESCLDSLVKEYESKGYEVILKRGTPQVEILPKVISTNLNSTLSLSKTNNDEVYNNFKIDTNSNLYELIEVAKNIIIWEMKVGDSLPVAYMYNDPSLRVEKHLKDDDNKIYVLTDLETEESFRFATRSYASPIGIGTGYI